jgi:hypothetical protein
MTIWNTDTLNEFTIKLYDGLLRREHIVSNEVAKKYNEIEYFGYVLEKENPINKLKERYFVKTDHIDYLPFKIDNSTKFSFRSEVFRFINKCTTCKIPSRQDMTLNQMAEFFANYSHSNEYHWRLSRMILLSAYIERLNIRIVSPASFGKDALCDILSILNGSVANLYNATLGKLKYSLNNDCIIINELGGLNKQEIGSLQVYLTQAGAYKLKYENNSRSTIGTKEVMDLKDKSHIVYHNTPDYYQSKGQMYFEQMFTPAIMDRFPALLMQGYVTEDFSQHKSINDYDESDMNQLKAFIASLNYWKANRPTKSRYVIDDDFWGFEGKEKQRSLRSFKIISKYLSWMCKDESEFITYCEILNKCRLDYKDMIHGLKDVDTCFTKKIKEEWAE